MQGTSTIRHWGSEDPVLKRMLAERGLHEIPLFRQDSPKTRAADWSESIRMWVELAAERDGPINPARTDLGGPEQASSAIKELARRLGASDAGIALLRPHMISAKADFPHRYIVSLVVAEDYVKVLEGALAVESEAIRAYVECAKISTALAKEIRALGYRAIADHNGTADIQAIPALHACGMGELGKHGSLIHSRFGASFRPGFVLTDLPLAVDRPANFGVQDYCLGCNLCAQNCPPQAIPASGDFVITEGVRRWLTDVERCYECSRLRDEYCHICVDVCPYTHKENGDAERRRIYKAYMMKRKRAGYRTPSWFIEDEPRVMAAADRARRAT